VRTLHVLKTRVSLPPGEAGRHRFLEQLAISKMAPLKAAMRASRGAASFHMSVSHFAPAQQKGVGAESF